MPQEFPPEYRDLQAAIFRDAQNGGKPVKAKDIHINRDLYPDTFDPEALVGRRKSHTVEIGGRYYRVNITAYNESLGAIQQENQPQASIGFIEIIEVESANSETPTGIAYLDISPLVDGTVHLTGEINDPDKATPPHTQEEYDAALSLYQSLGVEEANMMGQPSVGPRYMQAVGFLPPEGIAKVTEFVNGLD